jgi:hypothetical protein
MIYFDGEARFNGNNLHIGLIENQYIRNKSWVTSDENTLFWSNNHLFVME